MANELCVECGTIGPMKRNMKGSIFTELLLWCFFIVPGVIYTIWRHASVTWGCARCGGKTIPLNSPVAKKKLAELGVETPYEALDPARNDLRNGIIAAGCIALFFAIIIAGANLSSSNGTKPGDSPSTVSASPAPFPPGDYVLAQNTIGAKSITDLADVARAGQTNDRDALQAMMLDGRAVSLTKGTRVYAISFDDSIASAQINSGSSVGKTLYVATKMLKK